MTDRTRRRGASTGKVHRVTSAGESLSIEQSRRTRLYLISMSIRTICFIAVVFTRGWVQWAFVVGAVVLPYVAVIAANAGRENDDFEAEPLPPPRPLELPHRPTLIAGPDEDR